MHGFAGIPGGVLSRIQIAAMLKAIHAQKDREESLKKVKTVAEKLKQMKLRRAAEVLAKGIEETLSYTCFPSNHWKQIRTNNPLERILREVRRRPRVVGNFPDGNSVLVLVAARLRHVESTKSGTVQYLEMECLRKEAAIEEPVMNYFEYMPDREFFAEMCERTLTLPGQRGGGPADR
jgi:putative transposase